MPLWARGEIMEGDKIHKRPKLKNPYLIVAWPGMGEVAFKAASYLVDKLKAEAFAEILGQEFFYLTGSVIHQGILSVPELPQGKFYYWKNTAAKSAAKDARHDLIIFISSAQPDLSKAEAYSNKILEVARNFHVEAIVGFASMPLPIDHAQVSGVWFSST